MMAKIGFVMMYLLSAGVALAEGEGGLKALTQLAPEYKDYRKQTVSLPITTLDISLEVIGKVNRFVGTAPAGSGGIMLTPTTEIGLLSLDDKEKEQAAKVFDQAVTAALSEKMKLNTESKYRLLVVSGEGGGIMIGYGGIISGEIFLLNTRDKTLLAYSNDPMGKGDTVDAALQDLALDVTRKFSEMAKLSK